MLEATSLNVMNFGARNDGLGDNTVAFDAAIRELKERKGGELYFPAGKYRFITRRKAAISLERISNVGIRFAPGAVLLMDNLLENGTGGGHGIVVRGPANDIRLENIHIKWLVKPKARSHGDAFRFEGFPDNERTISNIYLMNCIGENSPQTGAVFMGCSDIFVNNFTSKNTLADGLHFNACRRINVDGVCGMENGDDTLAFVTYYSEKFMGKTGGVFAFPDLNEWCNFDSNAVNIVSYNGRANGIRISGGYNINVSNIAVSGKWAGIQLDSALATKKTRAVGWSYLASRNINISNASIRSCNMGLIVRTLNILPEDDARFWLFGLNVNNLNVSGIKELGINVQSVAGVILSDIHSDSRVKLQNLRGYISIANFFQRNAPFDLLAIQGMKFLGYEDNMEPKLVEAASPNEVADGNLLVIGLNLCNAPLTIDRIAGLSLLGCHTDSSVTIQTSRDVKLCNMRTMRKPTVINSGNIQLNGSVLK